jgi:hypothetical protein
MAEELASSMRVLFCIKIALIITMILTLHAIEYCFAKTPILAETSEKDSVGVVAPSRPPDYEWYSGFDKGEILPLHTTYFIAGGSGIDASLIQGYHEIVEDEGIMALKVHSELKYQIGFGDHTWGYGPPEAQQTGWDISDRVYGRPPYYFNWTPSSPPDIGSTPFVPAYWQVELDATVKPLNPSKYLSFVMEDWIYYGLDTATSRGQTMTTMVWYDGASRTLYYSFGDYPNDPYPVPLKSNFEPPDDYFTIHYVTDFRADTATIEWADFKATVPLAIEKAGYVPQWKFFNSLTITVLEPGDLLIKNIDLKCWNLVSVSP